jgi:hypothetical protein
MHDLIYRNKGTWITRKDIIRSRYRKEKKRVEKEIMYCIRNAFE